MIEIANNGQEIESTNYWQSEVAANGYFFVSVNAGAIRLCVPKSLEHDISEMKTGKKVIITKGKLNGKDSIEILFDDYSECPYAVHLDIKQCLLLPENGKKWIFTIWTEKGKQHTFTKCKVRQSNTLPHMKPW